MRSKQYYTSFKWHSWKFWLLKYFWLLSVHESIGEQKDKQTIIEFNNASD